MVRYFYDSGLMKTLYNLYTEIITENQSSYFSLNISKLSEKGLEGAAIALFEVITRVITGSVT